MKPVRPVLNILLLLASFTLAGPLHAVPISGSLHFGGTAHLDATSVDTATKVVNWGAVNLVDTATGSFSGLTGHSVNVNAPWTFYSAYYENFWNISGFQMNLSSSTVFDNYGGVMTVFLAGTVFGNSYDPTGFVGWVKIFDPAAPGGDFKYTESLDFVSTPDGGTTILLLGLTLSGLALLRRKSPSA